MNHLDTLGRLLVTVRDETIDGAFAILHGKMKDKGSQKLAPVLTGLSAEQTAAVEALVVRAVDKTMMRLLSELEGPQTAVSLIVDDGARRVDAKEVSDGLGGEYAGWVPRYSAGPLGVFGDDSAMPRK